MNAQLDDPLYYLHNFQTVLDWVGQRHAPLLAEPERVFLAVFPTLPLPARALLVRMVMRKGALFRAAKLDYAEIGPVATAMQPLLALGWVDDRPPLALPALFELFTKAEITAGFAAHIPRRGLGKPQLLETLLPLFPEPRETQAWFGPAIDTVYALNVQPLCDRLRLLFFGNLRQDWSEFVLSELGIFRYETVALEAGSAAFRHRGDVDDYLRLHQCRERFEQAEPVAELLRELPATDNPWLATRRAKLLFEIARHCERGGELAQAQQLYAQLDHPGARVRRIRVLELAGEFDAALALAQQAEREPESAAETQQLQRMLPRLRRHAGLPPSPRPRSAPIESIELELTLCDDGVEFAALAHFTAPASPVYYVENTLFNALFGLLCWDAVFAPLPGAFFHPFQQGPADLHDPDFHRRRAPLFEACLAQLDSGEYRATIRRRFTDKCGVLSPFVHWGALDETLLEHALACVSAAHLKTWCEWLLQDIRTNRAGLPDLIQFWPAEGRYRMIEVKGPGDRLQDNQRRWLDHCAAHGLPVAVCQVRWAEPAR